MSRIGIFAGSFCPMTIGHDDAIRRASSMVDKLYVVVGVNIDKVNAISLYDRMDMLQCALGDVDNIEVVHFDGMMTEFCNGVGATVMFKNVRNALELQSVIDLADINKNYWGGETVFLVSASNMRHISSSLVREVASMGQDLSPYVPASIVDAVSKVLKNEK